MGSKRSSKIKVSLILLGFAARTIATFAFQGTQQGPAASVPQAGNAQAPVVVAYQTGVDPSKVAQAEGRYEAATGTQITWRKFDSGADVIAAVYPQRKLLCLQQNGRENRRKSAVFRE